MQWGCDFISGWISGIAGLIIGHPLDTIKVRQQTFQQHRMIPIIKDTFNNEGIRGFYKGMLFPAISTGAYNSVFFGVYGTSLKLLYRDQPLENSGRRFCCEAGLLPPSWHSYVFLAGAIGGAISVTVGTPIELIKIQLQVMTGNAAEGKMAGKVTGPFSCTKEIIKLRGFKGLYIGAVSQLIRDTPSFALYILSYEHIVCMYQGPLKPGERTRALYEIIAGGLAGILSWVLFMPIDVIKSKIQADDLKNPKYKGIIDCSLKSYKQEGGGIFFKGMLACTVRAFPVNAVLFFVYQFIIDKCDTFYSLR